MPYLARICFIILTINLAIPLIADSEFQGNVPLGFAEGLLSGPDFGQPTFYSDIVDSFPNFEIPEQFELLGSADLVYVTRVILRSNLNLKDARQSLAHYLRSTEFNIVPQSKVITESIGFISLDLPILPLTFCNDKFGSVLARFRESNSGSIVTLDHSLAGASSGLTCTEYIKQSLEEVAFVESHRSSGLRNYQPRMVLPQPPSDKKMSYGAGIRGTGADDFYESTTVLVTVWSLAETYKHFADQISTQGWELRSENTVGATSVGEWLNPPDADLSLIGTFTVQKTGESRFKLVFRMDRNLYIPNLNNGPSSPFRIPVR